VDRVAAGLSSNMHVLLLELLRFTSTLLFKRRKVPREHEKASSQVYLQITEYNYPAAEVELESLGEVCFPQV
jgi:hypothetical protein